jgi:hypothetical protein
MTITHPIVYAAFINLFLSSFSLAAQLTCQQITEQAEQQQALFNPPSSYAVIGKGRLYFHTAPDNSCRSRDVFVITGDELIAYTEYQGWYSVMYINPRSGQDFHGWVRPERLTMRGTIRPVY